MVSAYKYIEVIWLVVGFVLLLGIAKISQGDFIYDLEAYLTPQHVLYEEEEPFYFDMFTIYTEGEATVTFENYGANMFYVGEPQEQHHVLYQPNDPYLYIYTLQQQSFNGFSGYTSSYVLTDEDDDGNYWQDEGLYFFLEDITFNNELIALVTSYESGVIGTVDFTITSNKELSIIPEPQAFALITAGALTLLIIKRVVS